MRKVYFGLMREKCSSLFFNDRISEFLRYFYRPLSINLFLISIFIGLTSIQSKAQESALWICINTELCLGDSVELYCTSCDATTDVYEGFGVVMDADGNYFFDSNITGSGFFSIVGHCGNLGDAVCEFNVYPAVNIQINDLSNPSYTICANDNVALHATGAESFVWSPSSGLTSTTGADVYASPSVTTTYTVVGTTEHGCVDSTSVTIYVQPNSSVNITADTTQICPGQSVNLTFSGSVNGTYYLVQNGQYVPTNGNTYTTTIQQTTLFNVDVLGLSCVGGSSVSVQVLDVPSFSLSENPSPICAGATTNLYATGAAGLSFSWTPSSTLNTNTGYHVLATPPVTTTYSVTATDGGPCPNTEQITVAVYANCCTTSATVPQNYLISGINPTWSGLTYFIEQNIVVSAGVHFTISNCVLWFKPGVGIILQDGADLDVSASTLTRLENCTGFWKGISATRLNQTGLTDKSIVTIKDTEISLAQVGLSLFTVDVTTNNSASQWAQFQVVRSNFRNNKKDVLLNGASPNPTVGSSINGSFSNCKFKTDLHFEYGYMPDASRCEINNAGKQISLIDCQFLNNVPEFVANLEYKAVLLKNSRVAYTGSHNTDPDSTLMQIGSITSGFDRGVYSKGIGSIYIKEVLFHTWRGVYIRNKGYHQVLSCKFFNLPSDIMNHFLGINVGTSPSGITLENLDSPQAPYGAYIDGNNTTFKIQDCDFATAVNSPGFGPWLSHGVIINNGGDLTSQVRRNHFSGMQRALKLQGDNVGNDVQHGIFYSCNTFMNNLTDIRELGSSTTASSAWGVPHQKGGIDPNNTFSYSNDVYDDILNVTTTHSYYRYASNNPLTSEVTTNSVNLIPTPFIELCAGFSGLIVNQDNSTNSEVCVYRNLVSNSYKDLMGEYNNLLDGGNTEAVINSIESITFSNALESYYQLLEKSPYLSEEAILEALNQYNLPNALLVQILQSNPWAAKSDVILDEIENRMIPFDEYQKTQMMMGRTVFSSKEQMEAQMASYETERFLLTQALWQRYEEDTTGYYNDDSLLVLLDEQHWEQDFWLKLNYFDAKNDYPTCLNLITQARTNLVFAPTLRNDIDALEDYYTLRSNYHADGSGPLSSQDKSILEGYLNSTSSFVSNSAMDFLVLKGVLDYKEPIMDDDLQERSMHTKINKSKVEIKIYPNPTSGLCTIGGLQDVQRLEMINATGQLVLRTNISNGQGQIALDLSSFSAGIYTVRLLDTTGLSIGQYPIIKE